MIDDCYTTTVDSENRIMQFIHGKEFTDLGYAFVARVTARMGGGAGSVTGAASGRAGGSRQHDVLA